MGNVYSRLQGITTVVLTDRRPAPAQEAASTIACVRGRQMRKARWGLLHPKSAFEYARIAVDIRRMTRNGVSGVHCGRVLPEGLSALLAFTAGGFPYACWVHGEELAYIDSSRELRHLAMAVFRRARAVLANSRNTAQLLVQRGIPGDRVHVVTPGVDADRFRPDVPGAEALRRDLADGAETVCLTVGRLQRRKGHDLVLQALADLEPRRRGLRYVIVGDGEERPRLEGMIRKLGLESTVVMKGRVDADDLPQYYAAADLFLHPNRVEGGDFEGFGIVFLEAAACALPVIAGRSGGVPEAVADGETGLLVGGTDVAELQQAMRELLDAPDRLRAIGAAARARVLRQFTWQRAADRVSALHRQLFA